MKINNKCNKLYACPHKCSKCKLCEHHKMKTNYTVIGGGGIKKCNKCHKYCCYVCTDCEICDIHRKKYCCYWLKKTIINDPLKKLNEWCNRHLILIAHYENEKDNDYENMFKYDFNNPRFISGNDEIITYELENLLRPSIELEFKEIQCVLELSRFVYNEKTTDLYIDWIHIQMDFDKYFNDNFDNVNQNLQNYGIQMVKNTSWNTEKYHYVANLDFSNSIYHHITNSLVLPYQGAQPIILPSNIYCFKTTNKINGNTISERGNNFITTTTNLKTIDNLENYKGTIENNELFINNKFNPEIQTKYKNTAILIATFHIKDILTSNYSPKE